MKAGDLFIQVQADYSTLAAQLKEIEQAFSASGRNAAQAMEASIKQSSMSEGVQKDLEEAIAEAGRSGAEAAAAEIETKIGNAADTIGRDDSMARKMFAPLMKASAFIGIAENLAEAINVANEKGLLAGLESLVESTPVIGTAYRLGTAIGNAIGDAISDADEMEEAMAQRMKATESRLPAMVMAEQERRAEMTAIADQTIQADRLSRQLAIETARAAGDEREVAFLEAESRVAELTRQRDVALAQTESDEAERLIRENFDRQVGLEQMAIDAKYAELDRRDAEEISKREELERKAAERIAEIESRDAKKLADEERREAEKLMEEEQRAAEKLQKFIEDSERERYRQIKSLEEERLAAQVGGISDANTALGTFKFDAYPATAKKANDERIVKALEAIRAQGMTSAAGGFN
jgi:hypothetical protein